MTDYSRYAYKRKRRKGGGAVAVALVVAIAAVAFLVGNLLFGFVNFGGGAYSGASLPSANVWALEIETFNLKANALSKGREVRVVGGAGFVTLCTNVDCENGRENCWCVLYNCYTSKTEAEIALLGLGEELKAKAVVREISILEQQVTLGNAKHNKSFNQISQSFRDNFELFSDSYKKYTSGAITAKEIAADALLKYNEFQQAVIEFDHIQGNTQSEFYAKLLLASNKQLLALYLLSMEGGSANFGSALASCICSIIFAYQEINNVK